MEDLKTTNWIPEGAGRPRIFITPEELWGAFQEYINWIRNNPTYKREAIKSGNRAGEIVEIDIERPLLLGTFCTFCGIHTDTFRNYESRENFAEFFDTCKKIRQIIDAQILDGGVAGKFNPMLVARKLGLADKIAAQVDDKRKSVDELFPDDEELNNEKNKPEPEAPGKESKG